MSTSDLLEPTRAILFDACEWATQNGYEVNNAGFVSYVIKTGKTYCCAIGAALLQQHQVTPHGFRAKDLPYTVLFRDSILPLTTGQIWSVINGFDGVGPSSDWDESFYELGKELRAKYVIHHPESTLR